MTVVLISLLLVCVCARAFTAATCIVSEDE